MNIIMLVQHPQIRGPLPKHTPLLVAALEQQGHTVATVTWGRRRENEGLLIKAIQRTSDLITIARVKEGADVAVIKTAHDWWTLARDIGAAWMLRRRVGRVVIQFHGSQSARLIQPGSPAFKLATRLLLRLTDAIMVLSTEERREWQQFCPRLPVYVVKNPYVRRSVPPAREPVDASPLRLLFVGRLIREKGVLDVVTAFAKVLRETSCTLVIAGDGPAREMLTRLVDDLGVSERVELRGYLDGPDLESEYARAAIFVFPTGHAEGFPTVLAEAMDAGLAIVTTKSRGAADFLEEPVNALFVPPRDVDAIADAVLMLLKDVELRARMREANRTAIEQFAPAIAGREYADVLERVLAEPPR